MFRTQVFDEVQTQAVRIIRLRKPDALTSPKFVKKIKKRVKNPKCFE